jgi:hypothetical protein
LARTSFETQLAPRLALPGEEHGFDTTDDLIAPTIAFSAMFH